MRSALKTSMMAGLAFMALASATQAQEVVRLRGSIRSVQADSATISTLLSGDATFSLTKNTGVVTASAGKLSDIKPGSFIGSAARTLPDGSMEALEVHVFPESMRGAGEGHRPWDLGADTTMTNGSVDLGSAISASNHRLVVKYSDGSKTISVPADVPVVLAARSDRTALTPGAQAVVTASRATDGSLVALYVIVGKNGVRPPM